MNISTIDHEMVREVLIKSRQKHWIVKHRWFALFVGVPTLIATIYYGFIATPVYVSQSSFVIKTPGQKSSPTFSLANLVQSSGLSSGREQTSEVLQYIHSRNALKDLQTKFGIDLRRKYARLGVDFLSRFPQPLHDSSFENLYRYYGSMVGADTDADSGLAVLETHAFTPQDALEINSKLLTLSEDLVNRLNQRAEGHAISEAEKRVVDAENRVRNARVEISAFRNSQQLIDPSKQAAGVLDISNKLISEQATLQAQLQLMMRVAPRNPAIPALRSRIVAVGREIAAQNGRAVGTPTGIASKMGAYEKLQVEEEFATQMLTAASASLEQARTDAQKQQFYLERVVEPNLPDDATFPHRLKRILVVFGTAVCLYLVGWMLVVGILEHAPED
jgi:capsular polysaccharide transport system permease protein